ncbi:MAG: DUF2867 domain-containing protein [Nannocystales bacterium]
MRLTTEEHASHAWRLPEVAPDFTLLDAWKLPASGGEDEFDGLLALWSALDPTQESSGFSRVLFRVRDRLGQWFGWDEETNTLPIPGCRESSLRERLPADLPALPIPNPAKSPFVPVFRAEREWAGELSNSTVHAVLQLGWVRRDDGRFDGRLGVYVKARGWFGRAYMAAIAPFRHYIVYPALMRQVGRLWQARSQHPRGS